MSEVATTHGRLLADRYRLGEVLGKGGMGTVWRALDETLGRSVAVKELRFPGNVDEDEKRRLVTRTLREAKATARIRNTGAITVFDVVKEDDRPWIVMELVEGRSLSDAIREDGPLTPKRAAEVGLVLLDVLKAAHAEGILHRDVKPSNVLIAHTGRVVLGDFGIAKIDGDPSVTSTGMLVGAPSYISPERARGQKPGPPADLWSLGALLYASVEGHPPYDKGSAIATLTAVMTEPVGPMTNAGPLAEVISGLLVKDPARRLDDAGARRLLTAVAHAPDRPFAPPAQGEAATRTVPLPVDPQPVPSDAPPAARRAAADQERMRNALRSVRRAAAQPLDSGSGTEPTGAHPAPPRRGLAVVIAVVVLALLGTVIGVALAASGGKGGGGAKKHSGTSAAPSTAAGGHGKGRGKGGTHADESAEGRPSAVDTPAADHPSGGPGSGGPGSGAADDSLPPGYTMVTNATYHFRIALPAGWKQTGSTSGGGGAIYSAHGGFPRVQIDFTDTPGKDAAATWRGNEPAVRDTSDNYRLISIQSVSYRGYPTAADWNFLRTESDGTKSHVLNRGFVVDKSHGYAIMFSAARAQWDTAPIKAMRDAFFRSFQPTH